MSGVLEVASAILSASEQRLDVAAQNIANMQTPGFKRRVAFTSLLADVPNVGDAAQFVSSRSDFAQGALTKTGSPLDLAISGSGFFTLRLGDKLVYARGGSFARDGAGRLVRLDGFALQGASGGDVVLKPGAFAIAADGAVTQNGAEVTRVALQQSETPERLQPGEGGFVAPSDLVMSEVAAPAIHQGMLEGSNVESGREMVNIIEASRRAESGRQIIQVYDALLGRVVDTFGGAQ